MEKTQRPWGHWSVLQSYDNVKVKELVVEPGEKLSMQRHKLRSEFWFVAQGTATLNKENSVQKINKFDHIWINLNEWHQLENQTSEILKIVEIQWGERCEEEDIERK